MLDAAVPAGFQNIDEADQIALHVGMRILDRIAYAGLRGQIHHPLRFEIGEGALHRTVVFQRSLHEGKIRVRRQAIQPCALQVHVVIGIQIVVAEHGFAARQQTLRQRRTNESGGAGDEYSHSFVLASRSLRATQ